MKVWGRSFIEIENEWTDDQFFMMVDRLGDRMKRENRNTKGGRGGSGGGSSPSSDTSRKTVSGIGALMDMRPDTRAVKDGD